MDKDKLELLEEEFFEKYKALCKEYGLQVGYNHVWGDNSEGYFTLVDYDEYTINKFVD